MGELGTMLRSVLAVGLLALAVPAAVVVATAAPAAAAACDASQASVPWTSCTLVGAGGGVVIERVTYVSDGLTVGGSICRPQASGTYPIVVINHSGFGLDDTWTPVSCGPFAANGYMTLFPDYRAFSSSPAVFCEGEVDDVLNMLAIAQQHPHADEDHVVMRGTSHGGCVTLRAYQRGVPGLVAAAVINPPTDMDGEWQYLEAQLNPLNSANWCGLPASIPPLFIKSPNCWMWDIVRDNLVAATGGTPSAQPTAYASRSVDADLGGLRDGAVPLLIAQGVDDIIVPGSATCATVAGANALSGGPDFAAYHLTSAGSALTATAPVGCPGFTWNTASNPVTTSFPADHYFFAYAGYDHGSGNTASGSLEYTVYSQVNSFLLTKEAAAP